MDDWKLLELAFDLLENAKEGERVGSQIYLSVDERTDIEVAKQHYKNCADNPFNNGGVIAYTGTKEIRIYWESDWDKL